MESAKYEQVTGLISQFDPFDVFEIGKHIKPEFVSETFTFRNVEFTIEIPFDMLEVIFAGGSKGDIPKSITTPKGTDATLHPSSIITLRTSFMVDDAAYVSLINAHKNSIDLRVFKDVGAHFVVDEHLEGFSLSEPRIAQMRFWYYESNEYTSFEGGGQGFISIANFTKEGRSETGPCDVSSREEAVEIAYHSSVYRLFRRISSHF